MRYVDAFFTWLWEDPEPSLPKKAVQFAMLAAIAIVGMVDDIPWFY